MQHHIVLLLRSSSPTVTNNCVLIGCVPNCCMRTYTITDRAYATPLHIPRRRVRHDEGAVIVYCTRL